MPVLKNPRHEKFAQLCASGVSATKAYTSCGYSESGAAQSANKLLKNAEVSSRITELTSLAAQSQVAAFELTRNWVINELVDNVQRCKQAIPVLDHEGNPTGEYRFEANAANRALELLGKHLGMFADRLKIEEIKDLSEVPDSVLDKAIADLRRKVGQETVQ